MKFEDLKEGEIYYKNGLIFQFGKVPNKPKSIGYPIYIDVRGANKNECYYYKYNKNCHNGTNIGATREATKEEKHWLNACIRANKKMTKEEALKDFSPVVELDYPIF
jgi:hypothetical protein